MKKAFISIITLLILSSFLFLTINYSKKDLTDFNLIISADTLKTNTSLNFNQTIKNSLKNDTDNPKKQKQITNQKILDFIKKKDFFIKKNNNYKKINKTNLEEISKVIIFKPQKHITVKIYTITNGIEKNQSLGFFIKNKRYKTKYVYKKNFSIKQININ